MAAEIRVDKVKARSGINTLTFTDQGGFNFEPGVGIGTTVVNDKVTTANTGKLSVGIASVRELYVGLVTSNYGSGYSYINVGTGVSVVGIATVIGDANFLSDINVGTAATIKSNGNATFSGIVTAKGADLQTGPLNVGTAATISANGNATFSGISTFGGTSHIRLPAGTTAQRPGTAAAGDFRYNTTDGKFEGYTTEWGEIGGGGGVSQVSGIVSTTSTVGFAASFAIAEFRSASVNFLVTQGSGGSAAWQTGKYLMIHDGTTVTVVEQAAVATGSMLATVSGQIAHSNAELLVTMGSAGVATCSAKIDTMADSA